MATTVNTAKEFEDEMVMINMVNRHAEEQRKYNAEMQARSRVERERLAERRRIAQKKQKLNRVATFITDVLLLASLILIAWVFASFVNVTMSNMGELSTHTLWNWNFFKVFFVR